MADQEVKVKFGAETSGLTSGIDSIKEQIEGMSSPIDNIISSFQGLGEAAATAFAIDKVIEFEKRLAELGEGIERTAKMTGLSTDEVQEFSFAVKMTGGDADSAAQSLLRFETNLGKR